MDFSIEPKAVFSHQIDFESIHKSRFYSIRFKIRFSLIQAFTVAAATICSVKKTLPPDWGYAIGWIRLCSMGQARLRDRLTIGLLVHAQCAGIYVSSECSAQMGSEQAGYCSSSSRNSASSTVDGKGDIMTQAHPERP